MDESKPDIDQLNAGELFCPACGAKIDFQGVDALTVVDCVKCSAPVFVPRKVGHFWLYSPLGRGGMGEVYKAVSEGRSGDFAVKIPLRGSEGDPGLAAILRREGEVGGLLGSFPHIVEVVEYNTGAGLPYLATRFVNGVRLDVYISNASRLSERQALDIIIQIMDADIHILNCGFLYRDIKPENVLIVEDTATAKLFDYGLCVSLERAARPVPSDALEGSPFYMPPERIIASPEGEYSEVYSLGMLLFHMLAGETYFSPKDVKELVTNHVRTERGGSVGSRLKHCSPRVVEALNRMIQRDPAARIGSLLEARDTLDDLASGALGYPLSPKRTRFQYAPRWRSGCLSPRNLWAMALALLATVAVALGGLAGWRYKQRLDEKAFRLEIAKRTASRLGVPLDVKPPSATPGELAIMIGERARELASKKVAALPVFDERSELAEIRKEVGAVDVAATGRTLPVGEVEKLAAREVERLALKEAGKPPMVFDAESVAKKAAKELGVSYPTPLPTISVEEADKRASDEAAARTLKKYPLSMLLNANKKIMLKYQTYKVGDTVSTWNMLSGRKVSGVFQGVLPDSKVKIGGQEIRTADMPELDRVRFTPGLSSLKVAAAVKLAKKEFKKRRKNYYLAERKKVRREILSRGGYVESSDGEWVSAKELVDAAVRKARKEFEADRARCLAEARARARKAFDEEKFFRRYGYQRIDGEWCLMADSIDKLLENRRKRFEIERAVELNKIMAAAKCEAEKELYRRYGYIMVDGKWVPAKSLLDEKISEAVGDLGPE